jgi:hypothetical protein
MGTPEVRTRFRFRPDVSFLSEQRYGSFVGVHCFSEAPKTTGG